MRLTARKLTPLNWLTSLKAAQLKTVARATGIRTAGRKDVLCERLANELVTSIFLPDIHLHHLHHNNGNENSDSEDNGSISTASIPTGNGMGAQKQKLKKGDEFLSVLSIDMGIQNLAFANLLVQRLGHNNNDNNNSNNNNEMMTLSTTLNAWHRIGVQELSGTTATTTTSTSQSLELPPAAFRTLTAKPRRRRQGRKKNERANIAEEEEEEEVTRSERKNNNFDPDTLAENAYKLVSALITEYKPTHVLIERQRFRSGGQTAVLEWSLRVGVFEGMLHAVLHTMRQLGFCTAAVYDVSPARVAQYWDAAAKKISVDKDDQKTTKTTTTTTKTKTKDIKKMKINLIGEWLSQAAAASPPSSTSPRIIIPSAKSSADVQTMVTAYLERWRGGKKSSSSSEPEWRIEKLDDLADCLLQGLTWLEWQVRRARFAREDGLEVLKEIELSLVGVQEKRREKDG